MNTFTPTHLATLGPQEYPKRVEVMRLPFPEILGFTLVAQSDGEILTVHHTKLKPLPATVEPSYCSATVCQPS